MPYTILTPYLHFRFEMSTLINVLALQIRVCLLSLIPSVNHRVKSTLSIITASVQALVCLAVNDTYINEAKRQLTRLSEAAGQDEVTREKLLHALEFSGGEWCQKPVPQKPDAMAWISDASNDHSPFEYSLAISQKSGACELRFLIEAQPEENSLAALQASTSRLTENIAKGYGAEKVDLGRLNLIQDLFLPSNAQGKVASWHSFATSRTLEKWKIYLSPLSSGMENSFKVTREAFERLGLSTSWDLLENMMTDKDYPIGFSLGLSPNPDDAEVKVYVAHPDSSAFEIAQKHVQMDPTSSVEAIELFYSKMAGGYLGPYHRKAMFSCFHFHNKDPSRPTSRTILYPMDDYAANDEVAKNRIEDYMDAISAPELYRETYNKSLRAVQRRPLNAGRGIHSWVGMKESSSGKRSNTFYFSPELFGCLPGDANLNNKQ